MLSNLRTRITRTLTTTLAAVLGTVGLTACSPEQVSADALESLSSGSSISDIFGGAGSDANTTADTLADNPILIASVVRVVDGDTVVVEGLSEEPEGHLLPPAEEHTVRIIGLDTPETVHPDKPVQCHGPQATAAAKHWLRPGDLIGVQLDATQGATDRYDRVLGHVWMLSNASQPNHLFGDLMITAGHATEYTYGDGHLYTDLYRQQQDHAKSLNRGLWAHC